MNIDFFQISLYVGASSGAIYPNGDVLMKSSLGNWLWWLARRDSLPHRERVLGLIYCILMMMGGLRLTNMLDVVFL